MDQIALHVRCEPVYRPFFPEAQHSPLRSLSCLH